MSCGFTHRHSAKGEMTNYRVRDQIYIVDRLFDRANLVLGSGKKAQKVEISREPKG
jgi:type IV secretion system protein TrbG